MDDQLHNSRFLKACRGEKPDCTPVWLMRQAGRYMPEYQAVRRKTSFLGLCKTPELAAQVTLDAQRILGVDAAILFADLLPILEPMGLRLTYEEGEGPRIHNPVRTPAAIDALREEDPRQSMPFVGGAIGIIRRELPPDIPLIGFTGAPFTLAAYAIEGGASRNYVPTKTLMFSDPGAFAALMQKFTRQVIAYLRAQIDWGVQAVQLFDSWVGCLSPADFRQHVLPHGKEIIAAGRGRVPVIYFGTGTATFLEAIMEAGPDVLGLDWHTPLYRGWEVGAKAVQGNLDPISLFAPRLAVLARMQQVLDEAGGRAGHIFNLGHGILPNTPVDNVKALVAHVHDRTRA